MDFFIFLLLLVPFFLVLRWAVWRGRIQKIFEKIEALEQRITDLEARATTKAEAPPALPESAQLQPTAETLSTVEETPVSEPEIAEVVETGELITEPEPVSTPEEIPVSAEQWTGELLPEWGAKLRQGLAKTSPDLGAKGVNLEALIGSRWLDKIGIVVLTIGIALFLGYTLRQFGPSGKVATGVITSLILLACGIFLERIERYSLFAKPLIGGGWAILYFTAFAAYNIEAAKIITDPAWALLLLVLVAAGMIAHSFIYHSQVVTGLGYGLAFLAIAITPASLFSLIASGVLAASLVAALRSMPWYHLGIVGVVGTYLNHLLWLQKDTAIFAEPSDVFWLTMSILALYWLIFVAMSFVRRPRDADELLMVLGLNLANTAGFLLLAAWQMQPAFSTDMHLLTGAAAIAYMAVAYLLRRSRQYELQRFNGSVAVALVAVTFPLLSVRYDLDSEWTALFWAAESALLLSLALRLRERLFRIESYLLAAMALFAALGINISGSPDFIWQTAPPIILYLFYLSEKLQRIAGMKDAIPQARGLGILFGYAATGLLAGLLWQEVSTELLGLAWLGTGILFFELGRSTIRPHVRFQGYLLQGLALGALFLVNLYEIVGDAATATLSQWLLVPLAIAIYYLQYWRLQQQKIMEKLFGGELRGSDVPCHAATALLVVLLWKQLDAVALSLAWSALGVAFFELGSRWDRKALKIDGHLLVLAGFGRLFMANFTAFGEVLGISHRVVTVLPVVAILYYMRARSKEEPATGIAPALERNLGPIYSYAAILALVVLARFEFGRPYAVLGWVPLMLALLVLGVMWRDRDFRFQSYLLALLIFARSWATNLSLTGSLYGIPERLATTLPVIASLFAASLFCLYQRKNYPARMDEGGPRLLVRLDSHAQVLFAVLAPALLSILLFYETNENLLTIVWTAEAFAVLALGFVVFERSFRLYGLALLLACLLKLVLIDMQGVETLYRIFSFIVLGIILLLISFGYTRYKDVIKRYL